MPKAIDVIAVSLGGTVTQHMNAVRLVEALQSAGYAIVPREPTQAMIDQFEWHKPQEAAKFYWGWMIAEALKETATPISGDRCEVSGTSVSD